MANIFDTYEFNSTCELNFWKPKPKKKREEKEDKTLNRHNKMNKKMFYHWQFPRCYLKQTYRSKTHISIYWRGMCLLFVRFRINFQFKFLKLRPYLVDIVYERARERERERESDTISY